LIGLLHQLKPLYYLFFASLKRLIFERVGHNPRIGGVLEENKLLIPKERPQLPISGTLQLLMYFAPIKKLLSYSLVWDFSTATDI